jgi:2-polyprenyl-3-methyl-5-hydroxy-6-metoxy-1,4-benzoquinol methylase
MTDNKTYQEQLSEEANGWRSDSEYMAGIVPPDWRYHRNSRYNLIVHGEQIDELLKLICPSMKELKLGCVSSWLTLALTQQGADAVGIDLSEKSLKIDPTYYESNRETVNGGVTINGVLHHWVNLDQVISEVHRLLKPSGLLWVDDAKEALLGVIWAGVFAFLLATLTSYADKIHALFKLDFRSPSRLQASIEAHGLSLLEGPGRQHDWLKLFYQNFTIQRRVNLASFTVYIYVQWIAPDSIAFPV